MSDDSGTTTQTDARIRRAPKYPAFMIVGGGIGAIVTFILTRAFPADPAIGFAALFGYFALYGVTAGVVLGAIAALVLDRVLLKRARPAVVELTNVDAAAAPPADDAA